MKIAFVEDNFVLWQRGGSFQASGVSQKFMLTEWESTMDLYASELQKLGHECVKYVPSLEAGPVERLEHALGYTVVKVPCFSGAYASLAKLDWRVGAIPFTKRIGREDFVKNADIVHYQSYYSSFFLASTLLGRDVERTAQYTGGSILQEKSFLRREVGILLLRRALKGIGAVMLDDADPESMGQIEFLTKVARLPSERMLSLPTLMIDPDVFKPRDKRESRRRLGMDDQAIQVMLISAVMEEQPSRGIDLTKNPFRAVRLFSKIKISPGPDIQLHVVGGGAGLPALKDLVRSLNLEHAVSFHGVLKHDEVASYIAASDLVFVPYNFIELNYGTSVIEAFACGRAACGFRRLPSAPVDRTGGFLVNPKEESGAIELAIRLRDSVYLERKGSEGIELAKPHFAASIGKKLESAFSSIRGASR